MRQNEGKARDLARASTQIVPHAFGYHRKSLPHGRSLSGDELEKCPGKILTMYAADATSLSKLGCSNANESVNNLITRKAPKSMHFSGSDNLSLRVARAVAQNNDDRVYVSRVCMLSISSRSMLILFSVISRSLR